MRKLKLEEVFIIKYAAAIRNIQNTQVKSNVKSVIMLLSIKEYSYERSVH